MRARISHALFNDSMALEKRARPEGGRCGHSGRAARAVSARAAGAHHSPAAQVLRAARGLGARRLAVAWARACGRLQRAHSGATRLPQPEHLRETRAARRHRRERHQLSPGMSVNKYLYKQIYDGYSIII